MGVHDSPCASTSSPTTQLTGKKTTQHSTIDQFFRPTTVSKRRKPDYINGYDEESSDSEMASEPSMNDLLTAINGVKADVIGKIDELGRDMNNQLIEVRGKVSELNNRVSSFESAVTEQTNDFSGMKARLNEMEQDKLSTRITVSGLRQSSLETQRHDPVNYSKELLQGLGIIIEPNAIVDAYIFPFGAKRELRLTIIFNNVQSKVSALKQKRALSGDSGIYFDQCMTLAMRSLFNQGFWQRQLLD